MLTISRKGYGFTKCFVMHHDDETSYSCKVQLDN